MGSYRILLFAGLRDVVDAESISIDAENVVTVGDLVDKLKHARPELEPWLRWSRVAVNQNFVHLDQTIDPSCEIALIPPVSGG